jgi:hypothetical protein
MMLLVLMACSAGVLCGCNKSGGSTPEAAQQKAEAKENFSKLPPEVRPGSGPGK